MTVANGRLESQALVIPTGGWDVALDDGVFAGTVTVAAGTYSPTTYLAALVAALNASASALVFTGSIASGESGTGATTIAAGANFTLTWTDTDAGTALGYIVSGPLTGASTYTSTYGARGIWLPDCPLAGLYVAGDTGHWEGGPTQTVSPLGVVKTITRPTRVKCGPFRWSHVSVARARQYSEAASGGVTPRSFERFIRDTMFAQLGFFMPGGKVRLYWSADAVDYVEFWPKAPPTTASQRAAGVESWAGLYECAIDGWVA